jgi:drug/metabolite transporter (DMT)-like permease
MWAILFLGLGSTGLAYALYFFSLRDAETAIVAAIQYLEPVITLLLAAWFVAEKVSLAILAGGLLIILGVWLVNRYANNKVPPQ